MSAEATIISDVSESFFVESESSEIFSSRVKVLTWSCRVTLYNWFASSSHTKFHVFSTTFILLCTQHAVKWLRIC